MLVTTAAACARAGGGQQYVGGGGAPPATGVAAVVAAGAAALSYVFIEQPWIAATVGAVGLGAWAAMSWNPGALRLRRWSAAAKPRRVATLPLEALEVDPTFSRPMFLDFASLLYLRLHALRATDLSALAPYVAGTLRQQAVRKTKESGVTGVYEILIGSVRMVAVDGFGGPQASIRVNFEANYTEHGAFGERPYYVVEDWTFSRRGTGSFSAPEAILTLSCPGCGASVDVDVDGKCRFCNRQVADGSVFWQLESITSVKREPRPPLQPGAGRVEVGTELPTFMQSDFDYRVREFKQRRPKFDAAAFDRRAREAFLAVQQAWAERRWELARPYESDSLFSMHRWWLHQYEKHGLVNHLEDVRLEQATWCKIESDQYFDAITVRMQASMKDYVTSHDGKVATGSKKARRFSEYWTFVRRANYEPPKEPGKCPHCGAPLTGLNEAGQCPACATKLTLGNFDWVVARIEQDEAYEG